MSESEILGSSETTFFKVCFMHTNIFFSISSPSYMHKEMVAFHIPGQIYVQWSEPTRVYSKPESRRLQSCKAASVLN